MKHLSQLTISLCLAGVLSSPAQAQWTKTATTDDFSGETVEIVSNQGKVISGPSGLTNLVYRKTGNREEMYWATPDSYICRTGWSVQMRIDNGTPKNIKASTSTSNTAVFFSRFDRIYIDIVKAEKILLLLQDGCGTRLVSEFNGNALEYFPEVAEFRKLTNWTFDQKLGSIVTGDDDVKMKYRTIVTGAHDLSFKVTDTTLSGTKASKKYRKGAIAFNGTEYKVDVYPNSGIDKYLDGKFTLGFGDKEKVEKLVSSLSNGATKVTLTINKNAYEIDISDFATARKMIK